MNSSNIWVIAYLTPDGATPASSVVAFQLDPELNILIHRGRRYDLDNPEDLKEFNSAQGSALGCEQYRHTRLRVLPLSFFTAAKEEAAANYARECAARELDARIAKEEAEKAAAAAERAANGEPDPETEITGELTEEEEIVLPPYPEWTVAELKAELETREIEFPPTAKKAALIALLEADDEADAATEDEPDFEPLPEE
jgi:hypothetical protein